MTTHVFLKKTGGTDALYTATGSDIAIYGDVGGGETVLVSATASGLLVDPNIEKVTFDGAYTDFTFARAGNTDVLVYRGATLVATLRPQTDDDPDSNGTVIAFTSGAVSSTTLNITGAGAIRMGGVSGTFSQLLQTTAAAYVADTAAPALRDNNDPALPAAEARGNKIVIHYTDDSNLDAANGPAASSFGVTLDGTTAATVSSVAVDAAARTVTLTLATSIATGQTVALSYTDPSGGNDTLAIQDSNGNDAATVAAIHTANKTATITFSQTTFLEAVANDGSITATATITLANDTFTGAVGAALGTVTNLPAGLGVSLVKASGTTATLSFTGAATAHLNANDVSNLTVAFGDADLAGANAGAVIGGSVNNLLLDFTGPTSFTYTALTGSDSADLELFDFGDGAKTLYWNPLAANLKSGQSALLNFGIDDRIVIRHSGGANPYAPYNAATNPYPAASGAEVIYTVRNPVKDWGYDTYTYSFRTFTNSVTAGTPTDTYTFNNEFRTFQIVSELADGTIYTVTLENLPTFYTGNPTGMGFYALNPVSGVYELYPHYEAGAAVISFI